MRLLSNCRLIFAILNVLALAAAPAAQAETAWPLTLRAQMLRLSEVGYRLSGAAVTLCPIDAARTGILVDYAGAYPEEDRPAIARMLGLSALPQIAGVVPGSAAAAAGLQAGDDIVAIDGSPSTSVGGGSADPALLADRIEARLANTGKNAAVVLSVRRGGTQLSATLRPDRGCAARFIINTDKGMAAFSDPDNVGLGYEMVKFTRSDDELALVAGHELSHVINRDAASKEGGQRGKEDRADVLGASLARCAGYDLGKALDFWPRYKKQDWLRFFRDPSHRSIDARIALIRTHAMTGECPPQRDYRVSSE